MTSSNQFVSLLKGLIVLVIILLICVSILIFPKFYIFFKVAEWEVSDWFLFIQTLVFALSAFIAYRTIATSKDVSRERASLDIILADNKDVRLLEAKSRIYAFVADHEKYFEKFKDPVSTEENKRTSLAQICEVEEVLLTKEEYQLKHNMMVVLNRHEFYAIGINNKLLDEHLFKRMNCANFLKLWDKVGPAVTQLRSKTGKDTLFKDFENLANRWKANPLKSEDIK